MLTTIFNFFYVPRTSKYANAASSRPSLPPRPQIFFGREVELKAIIEIIVSTSAARVAILGPGGVGKTLLAHAVLTHEEVEGRFGDSRYLVPCESLTSRNALLVALAKSLAVIQPGRTTFDSYSEALEARVLSSLNSKQCILCLDTFESPWDQHGPGKNAVEMLLAHITALPSVTVLITMRGAERPEKTAWTLPMLRPLHNFSRDAMPALGEVQQMAWFSTGFAVGVI
jgi:Cdc6-like AAA superfamily ATPase